MATPTRIAFVAFTLIALSACTSTPHGDEAVASSGTMAPPAADTGTTAPPAQQCNADAAQSAVGQVATDDVIEKARADAGATVARTLKPNQAVTMEYRADRLNLRVDAMNVVGSVGCG